MNLESIVRQKTRLDILGNLVYGGPCKVTELSERVGMGITEVGYHLAVLRSRCLIAQEGDLYTTTLDGHPPWVEEAVIAHQLAKRIDLGVPAVALLNLYCEFCGHLLQYGEQVVAVYSHEGGIRAKVVAEAGVGGGKVNGPDTTSRYHRRCYETARCRSRRLPPAEPSEGSREQ